MKVTWMWDRLSDRQTDWRTAWIARVAIRHYKFRVFGGVWKRSFIFYSASKKSITSYFHHQHALSKHSPISIKFRLMIVRIWLLKRSKCVCFCAQFHILWIQCDRKLFLTVKLACTLSKISVNFSVKFRKIERDFLRCLPTIYARSWPRYWYDF